MTIVRHEINHHLLSRRGTRAATDEEIRSLRFLLAILPLATAQEMFSRWWGRLCHPWEIDCFYEDTN